MLLGLVTTVALLEGFGFMAMVLVTNWDAALFEAAFSDDMGEKWRGMDKTEIVQKTILDIWSYNRYFHLRFLALGS